MIKNVLNIAAGFLPIVARDFSQWRVKRVINYDPLYGQQGDSLMTGVFAGIISGGPDVEYYTDQQRLINNISNIKLDLIVGVSPYGFSLVDVWNDNLLALCGYVMIIGNSSNQFIRKNRAFSNTVADKYEEMTQAPPPVLQLALHLINNYPSQKTGLGGDTTLNSVRFYKKIR